MSRGSILPTGSKRSGLNLSGPVRDVGPDVSQSGIVGGRHHRSGRVGRGRTPLFACDIPAYVAMSPQAEEAGGVELVGSRFTYADKRGERPTWTTNAASASSLARNSNRRLNCRLGGMGLSSAQMTCIRPRLHPYPASTRETTGISRKVTSEYSGPRRSSPSRCAS